MTNLQYTHQFYNNFQKGESVILDRERRYIAEIVANCKPTDLFVNSIWFENDTQLQELLNQNPTRAVIYSGMDWHDNGYRRDVHDYIKSKVKDVKYIGNTDGSGYFSFWLFFVEDYYNDFFKNTPDEPKINKLYMCLNRKRHEHRVKLVSELTSKELLEYGHTSLGGDPENNIKPLTLPNDIKFSPGDSAAGNRKEGIPNDITSTGADEYWNDHLINIVTETTVTSETFISEKTWKPILGLKPFMILGDHKLYSYLKDYGIDTFDDIFGTGYNEPSWNDRLDWIVSTLTSLKDSNYTQLYTKLLPRLVTNRDRVQEIFKINKQRYNTVLGNLK